jgi:hypothetical protein
MEGNKAGTAIDGSRTNEKLSREELKLDNISDEKS